jgi:hypothetical protein
MRTLLQVALFGIGAVLSITEIRILGASFVGSAIALLYAKDLTFKQAVVIVITATSMNYYVIVPLVDNLGWSVNWCMLLGVGLSGVWHVFMPTIYTTLGDRMKGWMERVLNILDKKNDEKIG